MLPNDILLTMDCIYDAFLRCVVWDAPSGSVELHCDVHMMELHRTMFPLFMLCDCIVAVFIFLRVCETLARTAWWDGKLGRWWSLLFKCGLFCECKCIDMASSEIQWETSAVLMLLEILCWARVVMREQDLTAHGSVPNTTTWSLRA